MSARGGGFVELLDLLGYQPDDTVTVCHRPPGDAFVPTWTTASKAPDVADDHTDSDVWFSVNGLLRRNGAGRGKVADVTRMSALYADLDVKPGGMATRDAAGEVIASLSDRLGVRPVGIVWTGHGYQPYWAIDPDDPAARITDANRGDMVALLRRFGRLVTHVAAMHGGKVDSVFDLARVLRVPGTVNHKADPVPTELVVTPGRPMTVAEIDEQLNAYNAVEQPGDRDQLGEVIAPAAGWPWAEVTHPAVTRAVASWGQQTPNARHPWLLGVATSLAFARRLGMVTETDHAAAIVTIMQRFSWLLQHHGQPRQPAPGEVADAFTFGVAKAERKTDDDARADWAYWTEQTPTIDSDTANTFWSARPVLTHIHDFARARRASPWAVLGVVLARVIVAVPPHIVLPPLVGGVASLNTFAGLVGDSGSGKGAAESAGADAVQVGHLNRFPVGSGEGLTHLFVKRTKTGIEQHTVAVLADIPEVDTLAALNSRQGSTLQPVLRQAYMGEQFGFGYADPTKRLVVEGHRYRLCLVVGIQPARAGAILDDTDGGTPQRYLWLPATDRDAPDIAPEAPKPWRWRAPSWRPADSTGWRDPTTGHVHIPVCETARTAIDQARVARLRADGDALDSHALLARLKVGAALALLDGRAEVAEQDWTLAGTVLDMSDRTRGRVVDTLRRTGADANRRRGEAEGERAVVVANKVEDDTIQRVSRSLTRKLGKTPAGMRGAELRRSLEGRVRGHFDTAIERLIEAGQVTATSIEGQGSTGVHYRLSDGAR